MQSRCQKLLCVWRPDGGARIEKGRECQVTIRVEGVVSAGREWPRREWQRALGSDEERRKGDEGE